MRFSKNLLLLGFVFILLFSQCVKKDADHLGKRKIKDLLSWSYSISDNSEGSYNQMPAIDENDNIYVCTKQDNDQVIVSLDTAGNKNWSATVQPTIDSRLAYKSDKLFFITGDYNDSDHKLYCYDAKTGTKLWEKQISYYCNSFAVRDNYIIVTDDHENGSHLQFQKVDFDGNVVCNFVTSFNTGEKFLAFDYSGNTLYALSAGGNTAVPHIWKLTDNGSLTLDWNILLNSNNGFEDSEAGRTVDLAIDDNSNVYFVTNKYFYCMTPDGSVKWKALGGNIGDGNPEFGAVLTDSANILLSLDYFYKLNNNGHIMWKEENYIEQPIIGNNGKYYVMSHGEVGMQVFNPDHSRFWYSFVQTEHTYGTFLHNGKYVYLDKGTVQCLNTEESGGLSKTAQWPKMYYDYGNTCNKK